MGEDMEIQHTNNDNMGKKSGASKSRTPKYLADRARSNPPYFAFAGTVNGGLFPIQFFSIVTLNPILREDISSTMGLG